MDMLDDADRKRFQRVSISVGQLLMILAATMCDVLARWMPSLRSPLGDFKCLLMANALLKSPTPAWLLVISCCQLEQPMHGKLC
jgi:hypothetical protein